MSRFERLEGIIGKESIEKLKSSHILIIGCGGVGGYVIEGLVRSGIGKITICDFDNIDKTNINRQIIALDSTVGNKKIDIIEKRCKDINPNIKVNKIDKFIDKDNLVDVIKEDIDYIVDACDYMPTKEAIIDFCLKNKRKIIISCGTARKFDASKLQITKLNKTSYDPIAKILRKKYKEDISKKITVLSSNEKPIDTGKVLGSCVFVPSVAGMLIANYVVKELI